ncbi:glycosyltransferase family 4 protein [Pseudoxanthomonas kalamensis]|uniref:glycosyltransferase family 4 protein n=1 Tax=Pseudoxanthomonas kalamensis TaxID=289483 RepID=UPI001390F3D9|nr:glycosyltransferase family 4 protein [Pseudoxanthomonas kalamensis]
MVSDEMEVGGSQRQVVHLLRDIDRSQWQPELVFFRNASFLVDDLHAHGVTVHHVPKRGRLDLRFLLAYATLLRRGRYDLVHAFSLTAELWTLLASRLAGKQLPLVASIRGLYLAESERFWQLKRFVLARSTAVIANARAGAAAAVERGNIPLSSIDVVPNGMRFPESLLPGQREHLRTELGAPENRPFGLFVGRLVKEKNLPCLLRALGEIPTGHRPWIALAGDGPLRGELESICREAGLDADVSFLGERNDATRLMQAADFLTLPSSYEGMSNVVMEAMAAGCPVVASDVGGNPELIDDGATGLLFPDDDSSVLSDRLQEISNDAGLRERLAQKALHEARRRYSVAQMVKSTTAVYARCLDAKHASDINASALADSRGDKA